MNNHGVTHPMRITYSKLGEYGRLGNQLFEIASTVGLAEKHNAEVAFSPWKPAEFFTYDMPFGRPERVQVERKLYYDERPITKSCDLYGYMQSYKHFAPDWKQRFAFKPEFLDKMRATLPPGWFDKPTVCIHIRRGDFVKSPIGMYIPPRQFFVSSIEKYFGKLDDYNFFIMSDDIEYCRKHFSYLPSVVFAPADGTPEEHMATGSLMQHFIISGSTFAWWTAWLGEKPGTQIIYNARLNAKYDDPPGYWPPHWTKYNGPYYRSIHGEPAASNFTLVWMTDRKNKAIHQYHFTATNPGVEQHVYVAEPDVTWYTNDLNHMRWWRDNRDRVTTPYVVIFDWDVLCNARLVVPNDFKGCACINMIEYPARHSYNRPWEPDSMPEPYRKHLHTTAPLGVLVVDRAALDALLLPEHAHLYEQRLWCEDRLPTIMAASGISLHSLEYAASDKEWEQPYKPGHHSIFHRVKKPVHIKY